MIDCPLPAQLPKATFGRLYSELELHKAVVQAYSKPLFTWRKALSMSHDRKTLYDFAQYSLKNAHSLHRRLIKREFHFRECIELNYNFNGKERTIFLFPWEERIVDLCLYRILTQYFQNAFSASCHAYRWGKFGIDSCQRKLGRLIRELPKPVYFLKRDVKDYFPSIDHDKLSGLLAQWVDPDDYLFDLLQRRIKFKIKREDAVETNSLGVGFGTAIACFFANLYLTPLDRRLEAIEGVHPFRYADDILVCSSDRDAIKSAEEVIEKSFDELHLKSKEKHHKNFSFSRSSESDPEFSRRDKFRHLGLSFKADGMVCLSRDKSRKIQNQFRYAFRRNSSKLRKKKTVDERLATAIQIANDCLDYGFRSVSVINYYLKHTNDSEQLRLLDRWLAEEVVSKALQTGHRKGNFKKIPFKRLRQLGLTSLRHRSRMIKHGHLESSFFALRTSKLIDQKRRRLPPGYGGDASNGVPSKVESSGV